jgi:hypothetical protein
MKLLLLFVAAFIIFLASPRCVKEPIGVSSTETTNGTITGKLVNARGEPAIRAKVRLIDRTFIPSISTALPKSPEAALPGDSTVRTDDHGVYRLPLPDSGTYNILGETEQGLGVMIASVHVRDTMPVDLGVDTVRPFGEINGVLYLPGQDSVGQVRVILAIPGTDFTTMPDVGGSFSFGKVPQGAYRLIFNPVLPEFNVKILDITVASGKATDLDTVELVRTITRANDAPSVSGLKDTTISIKDTVAGAFDVRMPFLLDCGEGSISHVSGIEFRRGHHDRAFARTRPRDICPSS